MVTRAMEELHAVCIICSPSELRAVLQVRSSLSVLAKQTLHWRPALPKRGVPRSGCTKVVARPPMPRPGAQRIFAVYLALEYMILAHEDITTYCKRAQLATKP